MAQRFGNLDLNLALFNWSMLPPVRNRHRGPSKNEVKVLVDEELPPLLIVAP